MLRSLLTIGFLLFTASVHAADITVENSFAFETHKSARAGALFMTLKNDGSHDAAVTNVIIDENIADRAELHTHIHDDGIMMMREVEKFDIPPHGILTLSPGGDHVMVMGLHKPLEAGMSIKVKIIIKGAEDIHIDVPVISRKTHAPAPNMAHDHHH